MHTRVGVVRRSDGRAEGALTVAGDAQTETIEIGNLGQHRQVADPIGFETDLAVGTLNVGGTVSAPATAFSLRSIAIGVSEGVGTARGTFEAERLAGFGALSVGTDEGAAATSNSIGGLVVRSGRIEGGDVIGDIQIGIARGLGIAQGRAELTGDVGRFSSVVVGAAELLATGGGSGELVLHRGILSADTMRVGVNEGTGSATGRVRLDRALASLGGPLTLGEGSTLVIELEGLIRGIEFGAIDADLAVLDGALELILEGNSAPGIYDIVVSGGMGAISGVFDAVTTAGIDPTRVSYGTEVASVGGELVEVFCVRVLPEPSTAALVALGLAMISGARREPVS